MAEPHANGALLSVSDLHSWYGESHILHGASFEVTRGEVVTLLGRNGAGKTTTLKSIMGIVTQRKGSVKLEGTETVGLPSNRIARLGIALCPEERGIFASLDVEENLLLPPQVREGGRISRNACTARAPSSRAASSRCWRSAASCAPVHTS
jgi:branched-chain amino acid transport system ATP-binding protein